MVGRGVGVKLADQNTGLGWVSYRVCTLAILCRLADGGMYAEQGLFGREQLVAVEFEPSAISEPIRLGQLHKVTYVGGIFMQGNH